MAELRGDGGARLIEEKPQMGFDFFNPKIRKSFDSTFTFWSQKISTLYLLVEKFSLSFKNHHVNRRSSPRNML